MLTIELPKKIENKLASFAISHNKTPSEIAKNALIEFFDESEDIRIAEGRLNNPGRTYTIAEAEKILGLES